MATKVPAFTYSGTSSSEVKNGYWYIYLKSSGTIKFSYAKTLAACIVGGGSGGQPRKAGFANETGGGRGGTVLNKTGISVSSGTGYSVVIGGGGAKASNGSASSAFGYSAAGGIALVVGESHGTTGTDGSYAFGDSSLSRYGGGGGQGGNDYSIGYAGGAGGGGKGGDGGISSTGGADAVAGTANTGGGGGGFGADHLYDDGYSSTGGIAASGGSGIVILRGTQDDLLPVKFNGTQLSKITFNGSAVTGLIYGGTRIFAQGMRRARKWLPGLLQKACAWRGATPAV